ncbi:hypothetical protein [Methylomonas sp. AM2-LC]|uniref:tetratricopeptide repeat protein n=1 Tax=Methylomonas sp. AM2-LC TaxID=3153301 RepID=UPI0032636B78
MTYRQLICKFLKQMQTITLILAALTIYSNAQAIPYTPDNPQQVLESLPARGTAWLEVRNLRDRVKAAPNDLAVALELVKRYIELGRAESDPRYYGYAEAVLTPWLKNAHPSAEVLTLRATLYQNRHEFPAALHYLNQALAQQPRLAQAWLTKAQILEVQGHYTQALNHCLPLLKLAVPLTSQVCINSTLSLSGQLNTAYQQLQKVMLSASSSSAAEQQWAWVTLAEMAERLGDTEAAEQHYQQARQIPLQNAYLTNTYADFLLDRQRYQEVVSLLSEQIRADGLLLRLTLAEQHLHMPEAAEHIQILKARFAASHLRGDTVHQGDEARFLLHLQNSAGQALPLALANWSIQREPRDARILLETALATQRSQADVKSAIALLQNAGLEDVRLQTLIQRYQELPA